jgi:hypothetical protein
MRWKRLLYFASGIPVCIYCCNNECEFSIALCWAEVSSFYLSALGAGSCCLVGKSAPVYSLGVRVSPAHCPLSLYARIAVNAAAAAQVGIPHKSHPSRPVVSRHLPHYQRYNVINTLLE